MAIRSEHPYNKFRFILDISTLELHDLENEKPECQIENLDLEHTFMFKSVFSAKIALQARGRQLNGCHYCLRSEDID